MLLSILVVLIVSFEQCKGIIYHLTDKEYSRMPPVFDYDTYENCERYCAVDLELVAEGPSELLQMIKDYSQHITHYNHSILSYGICVTDTCKHHLQANTEETLEACLNESLWQKYELKARVTKAACNDTIIPDTGDLLVAVLCIALLVLNIIGSYRAIRTIGDQGKCTSCFSIPRNWKILMAPPSESDPRLVHMRTLSGFRTIATLLVVAHHACYLGAVGIYNTHYMDELSKNTAYSGLGSLIVEIFFAISGILLAYHLQLYAEKTPITLGQLPKLVFLRWLRLTPAVVFMAVFSATLWRYTEYGPFWQSTFAEEVRHCRNDWWLLLLNMNNYVGEGQCLVQTWQMAADMQLTILGLLIFVLTRGRTRLRVLGLLFAAGVLAQGLTTYFYDLEATILVTPEHARTLFANNPTFRAYSSAQFHVCSYVVGMASGLLIYRWQKNGVDLRKYPLLRPLFCLLLPTVYVVSTFFHVELLKDSPRPSLLSRALIASSARAITGLAACGAIGLVFQLDKYHNALASWRGWTVPSRLTFSVFVIHTHVIKYHVVTKSALTLSDGTSIAMASVSVLCLSFLFAIPYWLLVEAPITNLLKLLLTGREAKAKELSNGKVSDNNGTVGGINGTVTQNNGNVLQKNGTTWQASDSSVKKTI